MVTLVAVGTCLIAVGPSLGAFLALLMPRPHLVVISVLSSFVWSVALGVSGVVYWAIPPAREVNPWLLTVSVFMQELMRMLMFELFRFMFRAGDGVQAFVRKGARNEILTGLAVGVGYSSISSLVNFCAVVVDYYLEDTSIYTEKCPINFFVAASAYTMAFSVMQILLGILVWPAYTDRNWKWIFLSLFVHLGFAQTSLTSLFSNGCRIGIGIVYAYLAPLAVIVALVSRHRLDSASF